MSTDILVALLLGCNAIMLKRLARVLVLFLQGLAMALILCEPFAERFQLQFDSLSRRSPLPKILLESADSIFLA